MTSSSFAYCNKALCAEAIPLIEIAESIGSSFYCTSTAQLHHHYRCLHSALTGAEARLYFEIKAKPNQTIVRSFAEAGAGASVETVGEIERAIEAGVDPASLLLAPGHRTRDDVIAAILAGVGQIVATGLSDLYLVDEVATALERPARVTLQLDLGFLPVRDPSEAGVSLISLAETLHYIWRRPFLTFEGLAIPSQAYAHDEALLTRAYAQLATVTHLVRDFGFSPAWLDLGSVPLLSPLPFATQAALIHDLLVPLGCGLSLRAGARLVRETSVLVARVLACRDYHGKRWIDLERGPRALLYPLDAAKLEVLALTEDPLALTARAGLCGPQSGKGDSFAVAPVLPLVQPGDWVALLQSDASVAPAPHGLPSVPEVLVSGARYAMIRRCVAVAEQMAWEMVPEWMGARSVA